MNVIIIVIIITLNIIMIFIPIIFQLLLASYYNEDLIAPVTITVAVATTFIINIIIFVFTIKRAVIKI